MEFDGLDLEKEDLFYKQIYMNCLGQIEVWANANQNAN